MNFANGFSNSFVQKLTKQEIYEALKLMPRQQMSQIYNDLLKMEEFKITRKIDYYRPHKKQLAFHQSQKRKRIFFGGNGAGKTFAGAAELYYFVSGKHPYRKDIQIPCDAWVISVDFPTSKGVAERKVKELFPIDEIKKWHEGDRILELKNGSTVGFKSSDSGRTKFQGTRKRLLWFDEESPEDIYDECLARQHANQPLDVIFTMTPLLGMSFMYERLFEPWKNGEPEVDDVDVVVSSVYDNEYSSADVIKNLERSFKGTPDERSRLFGEFTSKSGLLYPLWNRKIHLIPRDDRYLKENWTIIRSIDPHSSMSIYCLWLAVSPTGEKILVKEYESKQNATVADAARDIITLSDGMDILYTLIDTSGNTMERTSGKTTAQLFREFGVPVRNAIKDYESGYHCCSMALKGDLGVDRETGEETYIHKFFVFSDLREFIYQIEHVVWDTGSNAREVDPKQKQRKKRDHLMDAWRYLMRQNLEYVPSFIANNESYRTNKYGLY